MLRMQISLKFDSLALQAGASLNGGPAEGGSSMNSQSANIIADAFAKAKHQQTTEQLE